MVDDVSSAVVDLGSYEFRAGYSGEDMPRSVIPSLCGHLEATEDVDMDNKSSSYISGYPELHFKREKMALSPLYQEDNTSKFSLQAYFGEVNFDVLEELMDKSIIKNLMLNPKDTCSIPICANRIKNLMA